MEDYVPFRAIPSIFMEDSTVQIQTPSLPCELWTNLPIMAYLSNFLAILLSYSLLSSSIFDNYFHENSAETATPPPLLLYQSCRLSLCLNANYSVMANRCLGVCIFYFGVCKFQKGFANVLSRVDFQGFLQQKSSAWICQSERRLNK